MKELFDWDLIGQLSFDLDVEEVEAESAGISQEERQERSLTAQRVLESLERPPEWYGQYARLREAGYPWRVAAYIAWAASPKKERKPETQQKLATQVLGLTSDRVIPEWRRKYPGIDEAIAMMQAAPLFEHRADIYEAMVEVATKADYKSFNDRKLALELLGDYVPKSQQEVNLSAGGDELAELSSEELRKRLKKIENTSPHPGPLPEEEGEEIEEELDEPGDA